LALHPSPGLDTLTSRIIEPYRFSTCPVMPASRGVASKVTIWAVTTNPPSETQYTVTLIECGPLPVILLGNLESQAV
jgi:hypothetical protein